MRTPPNARTADEEMAPAALTCGSDAQFETRYADGVSARRRAVVPSTTFVHVDRLAYRT
jgi:hypothetical protein